MRDVMFLLVGVSFGFAAATYLGALAALVRPDHRNPVTRPVVDWIERH